MKKLLIETYGCQMNVADSEVVASVMKMAGYDTTDKIEEADAVFLNTCSVRDNAEQKIIHRLEALKNVKIKKLKNESIYNLQGQRLNSLQKGLNIVNGKKIYIK